MSTPNLKNGPEDVVRISGVYFSVETPYKHVAQRMAYLTVGRCCIIPFSQVEYRGNGRKGRQWAGGLPVEEQFL